MCSCAFILQNGVKIKTQKKPTGNQHEDRTVLWRGTQARQTRTKASRSQGERGLRVEKCFKGL